MKKSLLAMVIFSGSTFAACPLPPGGKEIIHEAVVRHTLEAKWIVQGSRDGSLGRAFSRGLMGSEDSHMGHYTLAGLCGGEGSYEPYCEEALVAGSPVKKCTQLNCEAPRFDSVRVWWKSAPISYKSSTKNLMNYQIQYLQDPSMVIEFDNRLNGQMRIEWGAKDIVVAIPEKFKATEASSILKGSALTTPQGPQGAKLEIIYPGLSRSKEKVNVLLELDAHGSLMGVVESNDEKIGLIQGAGEHQVASVKWKGSCIR